MALAPAISYARAPETVIDLSSFQGRTLDQITVCDQDYVPDGKTSSGVPIKMLGMAIAYFSATNGNSVMGHVGERFIYCRDSQLVDVLYEFFPLGADRLNDELEKEFDFELTPERAAALKGRFFVSRSMDPTRAYGQLQFFRNRTIHEAWLPMDGQDAYLALMSNAERYRQQKQRIQTDQPLPEYHLLGRNCATPVVSDLKLAGKQKFLGHFTSLKQLPRLLYGAVKKHAEFKVTYPSQRDFRILQLKDAGHDTKRERVVPLSQATQKSGNKWMLIYPDGWAKPLAGMVNTPMALAELGTGIFTLNGKRFKRGIGDLVASSLELVGLRTRFPNASPWTAEEENFFADLDQSPALSRYLMAKYGQTPAADEIAPSIDDEAEPALMGPPPEIEAPTVDEENL